MEYEINFLVLQSNTEDLEKIKENVQKLLEKRKVKIIDTLEYKKRKLAYKIKHEQYGFFTVLRFTIEDGEMIKEIKKDLNLLQTVARYIIVRADELPSFKEETPEKQEKAEMASKNTIKHEDVEKMLSGKKTIEATSKKETPQESKEEVSIDEVKITDKQAEESETEVAERSKEKEAEVAEKKVAEKKKEPPKEKESEKEDGRSSLEDLDKKLDEILNG